jgi:hypothetical protein
MSNALVVDLPVCAPFCTYLNIGERYLPIGSQL